MSLKRLILSFGLFFWWTLGVQAGPILTKLKSHFASQSNRPTMGDLLQVEPNLDRPEDSGLVMDYDSRLKRLIQNRLPSFIANLEKSFPNGKYVFLGRDGAFLADLIDGYYLSKGEVGRVVRLDASRETFNTSPVDIYLFLQQKGLAPEKNGPPIVFLDRTEYRYINGNFNDSSQLMRILGSVYEVSLNQGMTTSELLKKIAGVSLQSNADYLVPLSQTDDYFKRVSVAEVNFGGSIKLRAPHTVLRTDLRDFIDGNQNGMGGEQYLWSQGFGSLQLGPNGDLVAPQKQGSSGAAEYQKLLRPWSLAEMHLGYQVVSSKLFHHRVKMELSNFGIEPIEKDPQPALYSEILEGAQRSDPKALLDFLKWNDVSSASENEKLIRLEKLKLDEEIESTYLEIKSAYASEVWRGSNYRLRRLFVLHQILTSVNDSSSNIEDEALNWTRRDFSKLVLASGASKAHLTLGFSAVEAMARLIELSGEAKNSIALAHYQSDLESLGIPKSMHQKKWKVMTLKGLSNSFLRIYLASFKNFFGLLTGASTITVLPEILMHLSGPWPAQSVGMFSLHFLHLAIATAGAVVANKSVKFSKEGFSLPKVMPQTKLVQILDSQVGGSRKILCIQSLNK